MSALASSSMDTVAMDELGGLDADQTTVYTDFTPPEYDRYMRLIKTKRSWADTTITITSSLKMDRMRELHCIIDR